MKSPLDIDNNTNLYKYSSIDEQKMKNIKNNLPFLLIYDNNFLTFYFDKEEFFAHSDKQNIKFAKFTRYFPL